MLLTGDTYHADLVIDMDKDGDLVIGHERQWDDYGYTLYLSPRQWQALREFLPPPKRVEETT